jgi:hypothetical protein
MVVKLLLLLQMALCSVEWSSLWTDQNKVCYIGYLLKATHHCMSAYDWMILPSHLLHAGFLLNWFPSLKMEVIHSSKTLIHMRATRCHIPYDCNTYSYLLSWQLIVQVNIRQIWPVNVEHPAPHTRSHKMLELHFTVSTLTAIFHGFTKFFKANAVMKSWDGPLPFCQALRGQLWPSSAPATEHNHCTDWG